MFEVHVCLRLKYFNLKTSMAILFLLNYQILSQITLMLQDSIYLNQNASLLVLFSFHRGPCPYFLDACQTPALPSAEFSSFSPFDFETTPVQP
jgi:hypothetical protein